MKSIRRRWGGDGYAGQVAILRLQEIKNGSKNNTHKWFEFNRHFLNLAYDLKWRIILQICKDMSTLKIECMVYGLIGRPHPNVVYFSTTKDYLYQIHIVFLFLPSKNLSLHWLCLFANKEWEGNLVGSISDWGCFHVSKCDS